jgi:predicted O-methyltransferase YrrM
MREVIMQELSLASYADDLFGGEDELLRELRREAVEEGLPAIQVPTDLGRLLVVLISMKRARKVLEIGTLFGYSAILMARAMPEDGELITLEVDEKHADIARRNLERAGVKERVTVIQGPAEQTLESIGGQVFDLVFIDANKDGYPMYLRRALGLTGPGSIIVADNLWRSGAVAAPAAEDPVVQGIVTFNKAVASEPRLVSTFIPTRGGQDAASISVVR